MQEIVIRHEKHTRRLPCRLNKKQQEERCRDLAGAVEESEEAKQRHDMRKDAVKIAKEDLDSKLGRVSEISKVINTNVEIRSIDCETLYDYDERRVISRRVDTGDVVKVRSMTDEETQRGLYDKGETVDVDTVRALVRGFLDRGGEALEAPEADGDEDSVECEQDPGVAEDAELSAGLLDVGYFVPIAVLAGDDFGSPDLERFAAAPGDFEKPPEILADYNLEKPDGVPFTDLFAFLGFEIDDADQILASEHERDTNNVATAMDYARSAYREKVTGKIEADILGAPLWLMNHLPDSQRDASEPEPDGTKLEPEDPEPTTEELKEMDLSELRRYTEEVTERPGEFQARKRRGCLAAIKKARAEGQLRR